MMRILSIGSCEGWLGMEGSEIVGVVNVYNESLAAEFKVLEFRNVQEALSKVEPNIIVFHTPAHCKTSLETIEQCLFRGYNVYIHKLRAASLGDCERLAKMSSISGKDILIGENYHLEEICESVRSIIDSGSIGQLQRVFWNCYRPLLQAEWSKCYEHVTLQDLSYHHFGALYYMTGQRFNRVLASSRSASWSMGDRLDVSLIATRDDVFVLDYRCSWSSRACPTRWIGEFRIEGSEGVILFQQNHITIISGDGTVSERPVSPTATIQEDLFRHFMDVEQTKQKSFLSISRYIPVLRFLDAAVLSARTEQPVTF